MIKDTPTTTISVLSNTKPADAVAAAIAISTTPTSFFMFAEPCLCRLTVAGLHRRHELLSGQSGVIAGQVVRHRFFVDVDFAGKAKLR